MKFRVLSMVSLAVFAFVFPTLPASIHACGDIPGFFRMFYSRSWTDDWRGWTDRDTSYSGEGKENVLYHLPHNFERYRGRPDDILILPILIDAVLHYDRTQIEDVLLRSKEIFVYYQNLDGAREHPLYEWVLQKLNSTVDGDHSGGLETAEEYRDDWPGVKFHPFYHEEDRDRIRKHRIVAHSPFGSHPGAWAETVTVHKLAGGIQYLAHQITSRMQAEGKTNLAVVEFVSLYGFLDVYSDFGRYLSEKLIEELSIVTPSAITISPSANAFPSTKRATKS